MTEVYAHTAADVRQDDSIAVHINAADIVRTFEIRIALCGRCGRRDTFRSLSQTC